MKLTKRQLGIISDLFIGIPFVILVLSVIALIWTFDVLYCKIAGTAFLLFIVGSMIINGIETGIANEKL